MDLIDRIEVYSLQGPAQKKPYWVSHFIVPNANELLIKLTTKDGIQGFGMATSYTDITPILKPFTNGFADHIMGMNPYQPEEIYNKLFNLTDTRISNEKKWSREALIRISSAVDIACWDIIGKKAGLPLYQIFGGFRDKVPCYVTCAYYQDGKDNIQLKDEIQN